MMASSSENHGSKGGRGKISPQVNLEDASPLPVARKSQLQALCRKVLQGEGSPGPVNLILAGDNLVRELNRTYRKLDKVTDVLSFVYEEADLLGEIYIAVPQAKAQAPRWGNDFHQEMRRLVVHGALHLTGHDHKKPAERRLMRRMEEQYLGTTRKTTT